MNELVPSIPDKQLGMVSQYLLFDLDGMPFGISTARVREIIECRDITVVPMTPGFVRGVINLRGAVVPLIDLNIRFGRAETETSRRTCVVIFEAGSGEETCVLGIIVDAVSAVRRIGHEHIEPAPGFGAHIRSNFIDGVAKVNGSFVLLLDLSQVLSVDEISMIQGIGATYAGSADRRHPGEHAAAA